MAFYIVILSAVPPFGFLKKKDATEKESLPQAKPLDQQASNEEISVPQAQEIIREFEAKLLQNLVAKLQPVQAAVRQSHSTLSDIANEMEQEEIKLEDMEQRHKSVIENSRKTVISTLRREISTELVLPTSVNEVKKFRERMESQIKRFGEVSGSHSKLLNYFLKKHASKMKREFGDLESQLGQTKSAISEFDQARQPAIRCTGLLNSATQLGPGITSLETSIAESESVVNQLTEQIASARSELDALRSTEGYSKAQVALTKVKELEEKKSQINKSVTELFSHVSRVLTKYSYGVDKTTLNLIRMMTDEPTKILEGDIGPCVTLLTSIRLSVQSGSLQLKDSERMTHHMDELLHALPGLRSQLTELGSELTAVCSNEQNDIANKAREFEEGIQQKDEMLSRNLQTIDQQKRQLAQRKKEMQEILREAGEILSSVSGKKYILAA